MSDADASGFDLKGIDSVLSYRHGFHAGNFADVLKHVVLTLLLSSLMKKEKPFCYLETHAGAGRYDLRGKFARETGESMTGIGRLRDAPETPAALQDYLAVVAAANQGKGLRWYPGSPLIARQLLRPQDRMILCELHSTEIECLRQVFARDPRATILHQDGYSVMNGLLPPRERRGLVLCDPSFEFRQERGRVFDAILAAYKKWPTGIYAIWHPIQERRVADRFYRQFKQAGIPKILLAELCVRPDAETKPMKGSGMTVINPPWQLDDVLTGLMPRLWQILAETGEGSWRVEWLSSE